MIRNIIFDVGAVLVAFEPEKVLKDMGLDENEIKIIAEATTKGALWSELDRGVMPKEEVFAKMIEKIHENAESAAEMAIIGQNESEQKSQAEKNDICKKYTLDAKKFLEEGIFKTVKSFPYAQEWLTSLKKRGFKIYILSNYPEWLFEYHWKNEFSFTNAVDGKVVSGNVKLIKPDARIYTHLLEKFNLNADECVFLDDRKENIEAAQKCAIHGIVFTDYKTASNELEKLILQPS